MTKMQKKIYDHEWYVKNRSYKKTYARLHYKALNWNPTFHVATESLIMDRQLQKQKGRWIDEV